MLGRDESRRESAFEIFLQTKAKAVAAITPDKVVKERFSSIFFLLLVMCSSANALPFRSC